MLQSTQRLLFACIEAAKLLSESFGYNLAESFNTCDCQAVNVLQRAISEATYDQFGADDLRDKLLLDACVTAKEIVADSYDGAPIREWADCDLRAMVVLNEAIKAELSFSDS